ncbi:hypothetical protein V1576_18420 [Enterobacter cloacae subsp. dissolvens]
MALAVDSISFAAARAVHNLVANMQVRVMTARYFIQKLDPNGISEQEEQPNEQHRQTRITAGTDKGD